MTALKVIGVILLIVFLIGLIRVGAAVRFGEELGLRLLIGPFRITLLPAKEKKAAQNGEKKKKKAEQKLRKMEKRALLAERQRDDALEKAKEFRLKFYETATQLEEEQGKNLKLHAQINRDYENSSIPSPASAPARSGHPRQYTPAPYRAPW